MSHLPLHCTEKALPSPKFLADAAPATIQRVTKSLERLVAEPCSMLQSSHPSYIILLSNDLRRDSTIG